MRQRNDTQCKLHLFITNWLLVYTIFYGRPPIRQRLNKLTFLLDVVVIVLAPFDGEK